MDSNQDFEREESDAAVKRDKSVSDKVADTDRDKEKNDGNASEFAREDISRKQEAASEAPSPPRDKSSAAENEKGQKEIAKVSNRQGYIEKDKMVAVQRSNLFTMNDRHVLEQETMIQLKSGGGILGTSKINLDVEKIQVCNIKKDKNLPNEDRLIQLLQDDGIFIDGNQFFKNLDINVQKLEERVLNSGQSQYFKIDGKIKLNNDVLANELTRPADLAFQQTDAFQIIENNAIISDRLNSYKKQYYCIDVIVGKIILRHFKKLFTEEDEKMMKLKHLCKLYDRRVSLALIPFYCEKIEFLEKQLKINKNANNDDEDEPDMSNEHTRFLYNMLKSVRDEYKQEVEAIQEAANAIYELWQEICNLHVQNKYKMSPYELKVHKGCGNDILFNLRHDISANIEKDDIVRSQKQKTERTMCHCRLIIDGKFVAETAKTNVQWPNYEVNICDQFLIHVFTLPNKVQLEIMVDNKLVDIIDLVVPGHHVRTLTSASRLIKEYKFSRKKHFISQRKRAGVNLEADDSLLKEEQINQKYKELKGVSECNVEGTIFVKAEWQGFGDTLPPAKMETLLNMSQLEKNRFHYSKDERYKMLQDQKPIDLNDPRNELIIRQLRNMKNDYLDKLMSLDEKYMLYDLNSFRQLLLNARMTIPQLNSELINGQISNYYIEWLEEVHRQQAQKLFQHNYNNLINGDDQKQQIQVYDQATIQRRAKIMDKIRNRSKSGKGESSNIKQAHYNSVVNELQLVDAEANIFTIIKNFFMFERKLKPIVKKKQPKAINTVSEAKVIFHVIRGIDVPLRQNYYNHFLKHLPNPDQGMTQAQADEIFILEQVETFLEIRLVDEAQIDEETGQKKQWCKRTSIAEGQNPEWNELLDFKLTAKNGHFTKDELEQSRIMVYFTLFDQEIREDKISLNTKFVQKQNKYLGSFKIPLATILMNSKFQGKIRLQRPLVLQDYVVVENDIVFMGPEEMKKQQQRNEEQIPTYINLSIFIEPFMKFTVNNDQDYFYGFEKTELLEAGTQWAKQVVKKWILSPRQVKVFLENIDGVSIFIPKFLTPLMPPESLFKESIKKDIRAFERAARYVSLFPNISDSLLFSDMPDITCTSQEFIDLGAGDAEEHAILLCNYFNYIDDVQGNTRKEGNPPGNKNYQSYLVYGEAIPEGATWFVMRRDCDNHFVELWNPLTAEVFNIDCMGAIKSSDVDRNIRLNDPECTMKKIWCVVGRDNIWANIQKEELPVLLKFDLSQSKDWKPFISNEKMRTQYVAGQGHIQGKNAPKLIYSPPREEHQLLQLEEQIKKTLQSKFEDARIQSVKKTTNWNIMIGEELKKLLIADKEFEQTHLKYVKQYFDNPKGKNKNTFQPTEAIYTKYFVSKKLDNVLNNFEEYVSCARNGGTIGKMRNDQQVVDEDIRVSIVQAYLSEIARDANKKCWAVPINSSLYSINKLWEDLKNVRMHEYDNQDVEFSLSVQLTAYPNNVISVWIYVAMYIDEIEEK